MRLSSLSLALVCATFLTGVNGCGGEQPYVAGSPEGWVTVEQGAKWFRADLDTSGVFRDLSSLRSMAVEGAELTYSATAGLSRQRDVALEQLARAVKQSLIQLFRNEPEVVDSLFERLVVPKLADADLSRDPDRLVDRYRKEAYRTLSRHFREPRATVMPGRDIPVPYPDSLRSADVSGEVELQVYVDDQGRPVAIEKLEGVHPVLDDIAMKTMTRMEWQPAYLLRVGKSDPIASWVRFDIDFRTPESG